MSKLDKKREKIFNEAMAGGFVSTTWAMKNILGLSESEIKEELKNKKK